MPQLPPHYHLAHLWLDLTRQLHKTVAPDLQAQFGSRASLMLIATAVYLGTLEERPMTATKLADYVGMPRATVIRRLRSLCRRGAVEKAGHHYRTPAKRLDRIGREDHRRLVQLVRTASENLKR
ncbi:helix-turn-helix domain-containing protein [Bradyrhizobium sp. Pear76]|uniref:helix-turn-helix domain-containing protein n=1 Tax=Bradyrhizobium oropedii TaxID=1571201 RepID=UPI001E292EB6|nr:helix-turn-helix domain-containing protein [Bradyrhizobium oropedii]MCC8968188.1 helix-turn-helix domain-containing protein [Bradyrhizobium oropedii]